MQPNETKLYREQDRGARAEEALRNSILIESFDVLRKSYITAFTLTEEGDDEKRANLWRAYQILIDVENHIKKVARDGRVARKQIEALAQKFTPKIVR
jgi:hypothetical protein